VSALQTQLLTRELDKILAFEQNLTRCRLPELKNTVTGSGLATATLSYQSQGFARVNMKTDPIDSLHISHFPAEHSGCDWKKLDEIPDFKQTVGMFHNHFPSSGICDPLCKLSAS
jgi:hypothetical protein